MLQTFDLSGRVAVVTGGNGGIGLGIAKGLALAGARVVIAARDSGKSAAAVADLEALGCASLGLQVDVGNEDSVRLLFDTVRDRWGVVNILVNNAGINLQKRVDQIRLDEWDKVMNTNLTSVFLCCRSAHPLMKAAGGGKIINIGSMMSIFGKPIAGPYGASKAAIVQFTRTLATSWAEDGIQVNAVLPGYIESEMSAELRKNVPGFNERIMARTPSARWGTPADLAGIAVFLASAASDFITGIAIPVDGGYSICG